MLKKPPDKKDIREELEKQVEAFLQKGGEVKQVPRGTSGRDDGSAPMKLPFGETSIYSKRTFVNDVVSAIDERKKNKNKPPPTASKKPKKKVIYDDFGEPVRWEWVEE